MGWRRRTNLSRSKDRVWNLLELTASLTKAGDLISELLNNNVLNLEDLIESTSFHVWFNKTILKVPLFNDLPIFIEAHAIAMHMAIFPPATTNRAIRII